MKNVVLAFCLQKSYLDKDGSCYLGDKAETLKVRIKSFLKTLSTNNSIIYMIREMHHKDDKFFQSVKTHSTVGSKDIEIPEVFKPYLRLVIDSTRYNALYRTILESELNKIKPEKIFLIGLETHTFVLFTAEELRNRGYQVVLMEQLCGSEDDYLHALGVTLLRNFLSVDIEQ